MWNIGTSLEVLKEGFIRKSNRILSKQPICPSCKEQYPYNKPESPRYNFFPGTWIYMQYRKEGKRNRISPLTTSPICRLILQKFLQVWKTTGQVISRIASMIIKWETYERHKGVPKISGSTKLNSQNPNNAEGFFWSKMLTGSVCFDSDSILCYFSLENLIVLVAECRWFCKIYVDQY